MYVYAYHVSIILILIYFILCYYVSKLRKLVISKIRNSYNERMQ